MSVAQLNKNVGRYHECGVDKCGWGRAKFGYGVAKYGCGVAKYRCIGVA